MSTGRSDRRSRGSVPAVVAASSRAKAAVSAVADMATMRRSGRSVAAASSVSARPRSVVRLRSWTSSNTKADAGQLGVVLEPPGQHALGDDLDAGRRTDAALVAGLVADEPADDARVSSAIRRAAARVARRRGSSTTMRPSPSQGSSSRASGTTVVLPAPGGAAMTARVRPGARPERDDLDVVGREDRHHRRSADSAAEGAGEPWNGPGSPTSGMSGADQAVAARDGVGDGPPLVRVQPSAAPGTCRRRG